MAYEPTVWATGDVITAEKLNKAENGIASAMAYIVEMSGTLPDEITLYASYNELASHMNQVIIAQYNAPEPDHFMTRMFLVGLTGSGGYIATFIDEYGDKIEFYALSADAETMVYTPEP